MQLLISKREINPKIHNNNKKRERKDWQWMVLESEDEIANQEHTC